MIVFDGNDDPLEKLVWNDATINYDGRMGDLRNDEPFKGASDAWTFSQEDDILMFSNRSAHSLPSLPNPISIVHVWYLSLDDDRESRIIYLV
mmetsp:Transcript_11913/g.28528  ORF Transcript_11913/g.28528 Transcript_11913/m.28528 type:complete len:92 (-) Transcript_11913:76-351(-)